MLAANDTVRRIKSASRKQYGVIARGKASNGYMAVGAKRSDLNVSRRGLSQNARMWHYFTEGGEPVCDVCKRVGHVAKNCWLKKKSSERLKGRGTIVHSVVKNQEGCSMVERRIAVSVDGRQVEALLDFNAMENAVDVKTVEKVDPKLKIYDFQDRDGAGSKWKSDACGMVWLPVVIGSRSEKLRCVVVKDLKEKLVIGLPGLSFLGASINFATGDLLVDRRKRKKVGGGTMVRRKDEVHEDCTLVREAKTKCTQSIDTSKSRDVSSKKKSPEDDVSKKKCIRKESLEQVKDLAVKEKEHVGNRGEDKCKNPNQKKVAPVSGRGRKEGKVNVVSPKKDEKLNTLDHDEESESDCDSESEDEGEREEVKQSDSGSAKANKGTSKTKRKKNKKKGKRRRR